MPTKNIECQLAQGQIGRYLNGERFSAQAIKQLEAHVADCDECSELVTRRRQALVAMLGGDGATHAAVMTEATKPTESSAERLISALKNSDLNAKPEAKPTAPAEAPDTIVKQFGKAMNSKPLLYCAGLALVLLAMSYFSRSAVKIFGPTADLSTVVKNTPTPTVKKIVTPVSTAPISTPSISKPTTHPASTAVVTPTPAAKTLAPIADSDTGTDPADQPVIKPHHAHHAVHHLAHRRIVRRAPIVKARPRHRRLLARAHRVAPRVRAWSANRFRAKAHLTRHNASTHSGIRIYDAQGRPLN